MFGFLKKKDKEVVAQQTGQANNQNPQMQATKVEDDMASFEIPDFSDDDLNFDLGIGEFMPQGGLNMQPGPQGLPTNPQEKPTQEVPPAPAPTIPSLKQIDEQEELPPMEELPEENPENKQEINELPEEPEKEESPEEPEDIDYSKNLPKFSLSSKEDDGSDDSTETKHKHKKSKSEKKERAPRKLSALKKGEPKHYAQDSPEGFFVPKDIYKKIIVLADDISKKTAHGDDVNRNMHILSKSKKETIFDADNDSKSIRDLMLSADSMLFGGK